MTKEMLLSRTAIAGLPDSLLSDCILAMGKRGGGKSFFFRLAMERALTKRIRCGWIDAMGVGWGVTVSGDGKQPGFQNVVVFGGEHGHLPISENAGKALGMTLAQASFSWVLDLKSLPSKAARVRFMAAFVDALYENCDAPLLLFLDEVDLWAPQMILDKQGSSAQLLGGMHELVRRGRVKGLSVWMATQRPAEVSKGIISQADALVTFKLMAPQDLDAAMAWMKGHVGKVKASEWAAEIPTLKVGSAIVYLTEPTISIERVGFPLIQTLDTFRPPKKGEAKVSDKARAHVDLDAIRAELGAVEEELKANDPELLRKRLKDMERALKEATDYAARADNRAAKTPEPPNKHALDEASAAGYFDGLDKGWKAGWRDGYGTGWQEQTDAITKVIKANVVPANMVIPEPPPMKDRGAYRKAPPAVIRPVPDSAYRSAPPPRTARKTPAGPLNPPVTVGAHDRTGPERKILAALAEWKAMGFDRPSRTQLAALCDYHPRTPAFTNPLGALRTAGDLDYESGAVWLTDAGLARVEIPTIYSADELHEKLRGFLNGPQRKIFDYLVGFGTANVARQAIADALNYHVRTPAFTNPLGALRSRDILDYGNGFVHLRPWVFMEQRT